MSTTLRNEYFGPYKLIRSLGHAHGATRFVVLCDRTDTNYLLYRFNQTGNHKSRRTLFESMIKMSALTHAHLLKIESVSYDDHGNLSVITPYTGNHEGLVTLDDLLSIRDGKLGMIEAIRAVEHLLDASAYAHRNDVVNGTISASDILIDRYGCLQAQFYGFDSLTRCSESSAIASQDRVSDEVRSIVDLGYTMMTGLSTKGERIAPSRVVKKLDRNWDTWFEIGLDPIDGFDSVEHAINALPTNPNCAEWLTSKSTRLPQVHIGTMLRRFRSSSTSTSRTQD
ncbi:MAG: hypothetical protein P1U42_03935 [Phycisphaerales bacterium]|nr:hypothetical protein [Phycisphaerales bacterium]